MNENGRTMRLLMVGLLVMGLVLVGVCGVGGFFVYRAAMTTTDTRPCREQVEEFTSSLYSAVTLQSSAASEAAEQNYASALINARKAEEIINGITPPDCSDNAVDTYTYEKRAITLLRQSMEAVDEGRYDDAIALQEQSKAAIQLATSALERLLDEY